MSYASPQALSRALRDRAKREAANAGARPGDLLSRFYFERLLTRVFRHDPDGWLLKGGQAMLVRYRDVRHSRDIDLCRSHATDLKEAVAAIRAAAAVDLGDFVRYDYRGRTEMTENRPTVRVSFNILVGPRTEGTVSMDLVVHSLLHGTPELRRLQPSVPVDWPDDWPLVRLYPLIAHVADKVCALYEKHNGRCSTRYRDLVDLVLIALRESVPGRELQVAIRHECQRRRDAGTDLELPDVFVVPEPASWSVGYEREAVTLDALTAYRTLAHASELMTLFLSPVLSVSDPGRWNASELRWNPAPGGLAGRHPAGP
ncbi:Nucleotidyl transferase AbiEii toxin, Type IV TA system [Lentzea fradiae]|uniref:Nucleotidyl transferase AbiEii toxin, Type IV TA system n=1 Tax=Lentzea fradiae TaxID=200378 RepID=A0A1G7PQS3_9PSEU|nr:nucleotidyl transferase AbiEii/AbiGii toxin family protein [Lentzea fradiae]SDF88626.1 Nucleotidyl transferase AbiEii toxin, Type IV TA system [Lentzea fradiae]